MACGGGGVGLGLIAVTSLTLFGGAGGSSLSSAMRLLVLRSGGRAATGGARLGGAG